MPPVTLEAKRAPSTSTSTSGSISSPSSNESQTETGVQPLPKRRGPKPGTKYGPRTPKETPLDGISSPTHLLDGTGKRELPKEPGEIEKAIAPYRIYMRMPIKALSKGCELAGVAPLDSQEEEAGTQALAMLSYEYSAKMTGWFALAMFGLGVGAPRIIQFAENKKKQAKGGSIASGNIAPAKVPPPPAPSPATVQGMQVPSVPEAKP